jgi:hypothetical protein
VGLALQRAWHFLESLSIADMGSKLYLFKFESADDMGKVLDFTPWNVSGHPLFFKSWDPEAALEEIDFSLGAYWIQIFGLPLDHMTVANATQIGNWMGQLLEVDNADVRGMQLAKCLRIKVLIHLQHPLIQGFDLARPGKPSIKIHFRYERYQSFVSSVDGLVIFLLVAQNIPVL